MEIYVVYNMNARVDYDLALLKQLLEDLILKHLMGNGNLVERISSLWVLGRLAFSLLRLYKGSSDYLASNMIKRSLQPDKHL